MKTNKTIYRAYNETTRRFEEIDPTDAELLPGQQVLKMFWCTAADRFVTVPGASLYQVAADYSLALVG